MSNSYKYNLPIITGIPLVRNVKCTNCVQQLKLTYPIKQKLSRKPRSSVTNFKKYNSIKSVKAIITYQIDDLQQLHNDIS